MMTFKLFLEQAMSTDDGMIHFDWAANAYDDTKQKRLEIKALLPIKGGDVKRMLRAVLNTQEAKEADEIFIASAPAAQRAAFLDAGFKGEKTMRLTKSGAKTINAIGS